MNGTKLLAVSEPNPETNATTLKNHPDELWEDGVRCYLAHASRIMSSDPADQNTWKDRGMGQLSIKCKDGVSKATRVSKPTIIVRNEGDANGSGGDKDSVVAPDENRRRSK